MSGKCSIHSMSSFSVIVVVYKDDESIVKRVCRHDTATETLKLNYMQLPFTWNKLQNKWQHSARTREGKKHEPHPLQIYTTIEIWPKKLYHRRKMFGNLLNYCCCCCCLVRLLIALFHDCSHYFAAIICVGCFIFLVLLLLSSSCMNDDESCMQ